MYEFEDMYGCYPNETFKKTENQANNPIDVEETSNYNCGVCFENFGEQIVYLRHMATGHKFIKS